MIDADAVCERCRKSGAICTGNDCEIPTMPTLTPPNEWVSVKDDTPAPGERVIATDGGFVGEGYISCYGKWCRPNGMLWSVFKTEVSKWMPLPAPHDKYNNVPTDEPLTIEQLREMDAPVWCSCKTIEGWDGYWCLCQRGHIITPSGNAFDVKEIQDWVFYSFPPEGEGGA